MIEFKGVSKSFGSIQALDDISITFPEQKIIGVFGPNGAGKSTLMKMIIGLNHPDSGEVLIDDKQPRKSKENIAYLPEIDHLYSWWNIKQASEFYRVLYKDWDEEKYRELLIFLELDQQMKIRKISKGQRAKVKLLLTASRRAPYLLMDEPFSGIDILTRDEIADTLIKNYGKNEQTILISTHEINEIENLVDYVIFINRGKIQLKGYAEDIRMEKEMSLVDIMKEAFKHAK